MKKLLIGLGCAIALITSCKEKTPEQLKRDLTKANLKIAELERKIENLEKNGVVGTKKVQHLYTASYFLEIDCFHFLLTPLLIEKFEIKG